MAFADGIDAAVVNVADSISIVTVVDDAITSVAASVSVDVYGCYFDSVRFVVDDKSCSCYFCWQPICPNI
jgi:hypothetical protein